MGIKIGDTREIDLLDSINNENAINFKVGNKFAELTEDVNKTKGSPQLKFTNLSDNKEYYIREKFVEYVDNYNLFENTYTYIGYSKKINNFILSLPKKIIDGNIKLTMTITRAYKSGYTNEKVTGACLVNVPNILFHSSQGTSTKLVSLANISAGDYMSACTVGTTKGENRYESQIAGTTTCTIKIEFTGNFEA